MGIFCIVTSILGSCTPVLSEIELYRPVTLGHSRFWYFLLLWNLFLYRRGGSKQRRYKFYFQKIYLCRGVTSVMAYSRSISIKSSVFQGGGGTGTWRSQWKVELVVLLICAGKVVIYLSFVEYCSCLFTCTSKLVHF